MRHIPGSVIQSHMRMSNEKLPIMHGYHHNHMGKKYITMILVNKLLNPGGSYHKKIGCRSLETVFSTR